MTQISVIKHSGNVEACIFAFMIDKRMKKKVSEEGLSLIKVR